MAESTHRFVESVMMQQVLGVTGCGGEEGKHDHTGCMSKRREGDTGSSSGLTAQFSCVHTCEGSGAHVSEEEKALT